MTPATTPAEALSGNVTRKFKGLSSLNQAGFQTLGSTINASESRFPSLSKDPSVPVILSQQK